MQEQFRSNLMKENNQLPYWLAAATFVVLAAAAFVYLDSVLDEDDIDFDMSEEDESVYL
ncbi:hypothetical protein SAMN04487941_0464 [Pontibacter akesuensis]|uniref:Uncharacterized protein n=1 Tax=Pontibacter akesuensis TaxID=388950 RepID=A0A1I7FTY7_9BACT|nr:hypothetical protein SAMN04487941_0464 [Pontibacter akesuensis]